MNNIAKRFVALGLSAVLLVPVAGCGKTQTETDYVNPGNGNAAQTTSAPTATPTAAVVKNPSLIEAVKLVNVTYPNCVQRPSEELIYEEGGWEKYSAAQALWSDQRAERRTDLTVSDFQKYIETSIKAFMSDAGNENLVYSPVNVYMAFAMLAEITDGNTRKQVLDAMGCKDLDEVREKAGKLWITEYANDGVCTSTMGSSVWMNYLVKYKEETLNNLAKYYYAESFSGEMGSDEYNKLLQSWLNEQTNGLLEEAVRGVEMSPETVLALATTIYFKAPWATEFDEAATAKRDFINADGTKVNVDFLNASNRQEVFFGKNFTAIQKSMTDAGMWFILPDKGVKASDFISTKEFSDFLMDPYNTESKRYEVNMSIPKFDVDSDISIKDGMVKLGMTDVFDSKASDFTPLTDLTDLAIGSAKHAARVKIDETGCEAAAFTVMMLNATAMPMPLDSLDFVLDRPFIFVITDKNGLPTFVGIVNSMK